MPSSAICRDKTWTTKPDLDRSGRLFFPSTLWQKMSHVGSYEKNCLYKFISLYMCIYIYICLFHYVIMCKWKLHLNTQSNNQSLCNRDHCRRISGTRTRTVVASKWAKVVASERALPIDLPWLFSFCVFNIWTETIDLWRERMFSCLKLLKNLPYWK